LIQAAVSTPVERDARSADPDMSTIHVKAYPTGRKSPRYWRWLVPALGILMVALLVGPRVPDNRQAQACVVNVHIAGPFGTSLNCDSPEYLRLAWQPSALLEPHNTRQSRPGLIMAAAVIAVPLSPLTNLAKTSGVQVRRADIDSGRIENALARYFPGYAAYIFLNLAFLLLSFYLFQLICGAHVRDAGGAAILISTCFLLATNDVVKAFVWSPHTQMLNMLVPVFTIWCSLRSADGALLRRRFVLVVGGITGVGAAAYPLFVIVLPCVLIAGAASMFARRSVRPLKLFALHVLLMGVLAILPEGLWYLFVHWRTGGFYQHELATGQVVWIAAAWHGGFGVLLREWIRNFSRLVILAAAQSLPIAALLVVAAVARKGTRGAASGLPRQRDILLYSALVTTMIGAFYATTGLIVSRLAYAMVPPMIVASAAVVLGAVMVLPVRRRMLVAYACIAISVLQATFVILKNGPFS
jgi:hypothetical protein